MLKALQVRNFILIDSLEIDFPSGLIIISGQTGAGKSILLGALGLVLGAKADASMIGESSDKCVVEATFEVGEDSAIKEIFEESELEWGGGSIILRRVLSNTGRARAFVNDEPISATVLSSLASHLVDIHSQHDTLLLKDKRYQLSVLDYYAGCGELCRECKTVWANLLEANRERAKLESEIKRISLEKDYIQSAFDQLDKAALKEDELYALEQEQQQLANAEEIKDSLSSAIGLLSGGDNIPSMSYSLKEVGRLLNKVSKYIGSTGELSQRLESTRLEIDDVLAEIESVHETVDISPERLAFVEDRLNLLYGLMRKHSCTNIAELISVRNGLSSSLLSSADLEESLEVQNQKISQLDEKLKQISTELHNIRLGAISSFAEAIQDSIRSLELENAVFEVMLDEIPLSESGSDSVRFLFSSTGRNAEDVAKCASGGELSRIMLCLKAMMAKYTNMPSLIFDEIDTGVSGSTADKMGKMICSMGENMQVFAITHLPQVAAKGNAHYLVSKTVEQNKARTDIERISGESRLMEIARMLSGSEVTPEAVANAKALF